MHGKMLQSKNAKKDFAKDLALELIKNKVEDVISTQQCYFWKDIIRCIEKEEGKECKTNQHLIGM